jgi:enamine deaminase RidA (YjgF/YER057c/UK114 family)
VTKNYVEFRVYLKDDADATDVMSAANDLQDTLIDAVSDGVMYDKSAKFIVFHELFNSDVTFEVKTNE